MDLKPANSLSKTISVRPMQLADAMAAAELSKQLGYECTADELAERIAAIASSTDQAALVGCRDNQVIGWIEVAISRHLQSPPCALIGGLVVNEQVRSQGIGRLLCLEAEAWARDKGVRRMRVHSQIKRQDAHRFYLRDGYEQIKTSAVFEKALN
jgi:GNAT superfamily N-acetyltransferase